MFWGYPLKPRNNARKRAYQTNPSTKTKYIAFLCLIRSGTSLYLKKRNLILRLKLKDRIIVAQSVFELRKSSSLIKKIYFSYSMELPSCNKGISMFAKLVSSWVNFLLPILEYSTTIPRTPRMHPTIIRETMTQKPVSSSLRSSIKSLVGSKYSISASEIFKADYSPTKKVLAWIILVSGCREDLLHASCVQNPHTYFLELIFCASV